mmetsp:Transcript_87625/g.248432  ORF Transcript_87625/g.248432 Transcript_87625/m.248432 type:complete len:202 (-) Transcript_87625:347-952(-)
MCHPVAVGLRPCRGGGENLLGGDVEFRQHLEFVLRVVAAAVQVVWVHQEHPERREAPYKCHGGVGLEDPDLRRQEAAPGPARDTAPGRHAQQPAQDLDAPRPPGPHEGPVGPGHAAAREARDVVEGRCAQVRHLAQAVHALDPEVVQPQAVAPRPPPLRLGPGVQAARELDALGGHGGVVGSLAVDRGDQGDEQCRCVRRA